MLKGRLIIALVMAVIALFTYLTNTEVNPITGEKQRIALSKQQEIALGLQSVPHIAERHGGHDRNENDQARVDRVGQRLVQQSVAHKTDWKYEFHLLADNQTINAFALPGGQIFITRALYDQLETEGQLAGVLGHEMGHVISRHSAQHIAKEQLTQQLAGAAGVAAGDQSGAMIAQMVGKAVNMKYGREDEIESDLLGVRLMSEAGYDPRALLKVMEVLKRAGGGKNAPEFFSTHPNPDNRLSRIEQAIREYFPSGIPEGLIP